MEKVSLGPQEWMYPRTIVIVGANVNDKPNFMSAAACGFANGDPPMISLAIRHERYTLKGIKQNMTVSVNIPSVNMIPDVDYCGRVSGSEIDKVEMCHFDVYYGRLKTAPLIKQCPVNIECNVMHILNLGSHSFIVAKVEETYISDEYLLDSKPDVSKIKPLLYIGRPSRHYRTLGESISAKSNVEQKHK